MEKAKVISSLSISTVL